MAELKRTPLYDEHVRYGGKLVDFHGWELPVQYSDGIIKEAKAVREDIGVFDVSHMGEIFIRGKDALKLAEYLVTNNVSKLKYGEICYTPMCYEDGGIVDDLLVYKKTSEEILMVVNASNVIKDFDWVKSKAESFDVEVLNKSEQYAQLAVQGPTAQERLQEYAGVRLDQIPFYSFKEGRFNGIDCLISRTGYTGEDGFEFYTSTEAVIPLWRKFIEIGAKPAGLGARDLLRFEACYMLYGNEITKDTTPLEAGLKWTVDFTMDFIGKPALQKQEEAGPARRLKAFEVTEKGGIPRTGNKIFSDDKEIGFVTTGNKSTTLNKIVALGYVPAKGFKLGKEVEIEVRANKRLKAKVVKKPFYVGSVNPGKQSNK
ncbi:MAG: glycine cleavage system aminomethyltransferase GcvT [Thermotogota bacterium]